MTHSSQHTMARSLVDGKNSVPFKEQSSDGLEFQDNKQIKQSDYESDSSTSSDSNSSVSSASLKRNDKSSQRKTQQCRYCTKQFVNSGGLWKHEKRCVKNENAKAEKNTSGIYNCEICKQSFRYATGLARHQKRHTGEGGFVCRQCGATFRTGSERKLHKEINHNVIKCQLCEMIFDNEEDFVKHINAEHEGRDRVYAVCSDCGQQFRTNVQLKYHMESKCGTQKRWSCDRCDSRFMTKSTLRAHRLIHDGDKKHLCNYCGNSFLSKGQLKVHERSHTGEKPFVCDVCQKGFAYRESLVTHASLHTGVKPYLCEGCGSRFSCIGNLIKHRKARPESCGLPQYAANTKVAPRASAKRVRARRLPGKKLLTKKTDEIEETVLLTTERTVFNKDEQIETSATHDKPQCDTNLQNDRFNVDQEATGDMTTDNDVSLNQINCEVIINSDKNSQNNNKELFLYDIDDPAENGNDSAESIEESSGVASSNIIVNPVSKLRSGKMIADVNSVAWSKSTSKRSKANRSKTKNADAIKKKNLDGEKSAKSVSDLENGRNENAERPERVEVVLAEADFEYLQGASSEDPLAASGGGGLAHDQSHNDVHDFHDFNDDDDDDEGDDDDFAPLPENLFYPTESKTGRPLYSCKFCLKEYAYLSALAKHEKTHEEASSPSGAEKINGRERKNKRKKDPFNCRYCFKKYLNQAALQKHVNEHGPDGTLLVRCSCCRLRFPDRDTCLAHQARSHQDRLACTLCRKIFKDPDGAAAHARHAHGGGGADKGGSEGGGGTGGVKKYTYVCSTCGRNFSSRIALTDHEMSACGTAPRHECSVCGRRYASAASLNAHSSVHEPVESRRLAHLCGYCGKAFRTRGQVKVHERGHSGEKPFQCEFCPKAFAYRESLITHRSLHTGVKRHACAACGARFSCISNLQAHRKSHRNTCGQELVKSPPQEPQLENVSAAAADDKTTTDDKVSAKVEETVACGNTTKTIVADLIADVTGSNAAASVGLPEET